MTPKISNTEEQREPAELTDVRDPGEREHDQPDDTKPGTRPSIFSSIRDAYGRAREGQKRQQPGKQESRAAKSADRSKGLLILAGAVVIVIFVFLGMFSSSSTDEPTVRERLRNGISSLECSRHLYELSYPFPPADVVEFFRANYGPMTRAFASLGADARQELTDELTDLWSRHNRASDGTTRVDAEYLQVVAVRAQ